MCVVMTGSVLLRLKMLEGIIAVRVAGENDLLLSAFARAPRAGAGQPLMTFDDDSETSS